MKEVTEFEQVVEETCAENELKKTNLLDKAKDLVSRGYQNVKDYVEDNTETVIYGAYITAMLLIFGQSVRYMHTLSKTAKFEYNMKVLNSIREM